MAQKSTIDDAEIHHFSKDSQYWWDENGPFKPLHRLNPMRLHYIKEQICTLTGKDFNSLKALNGLEILDIGCGGGLVCEPLARMGASVTGIDADANAINIARTHSEKSGLFIEYLCGDAMEISKRYDVVLALEVIEHVRDAHDFIKVCTRLMKPNGLLILSTLNRTPKSYALGILAAEYLLRWVPKGTHSWKKFLKPSEIAAYGRLENLDIQNIKGMVYNPLRNEFSLSESDLNVNYLITLQSRS